MPEKRKPTKAELAAERERARLNGERLLALAERAEAALPPERRRQPGMSNGEWLQHLAEKAQAELDARKLA